MARASVLSLLLCFLLLGCALMTEEKRAKKAQELYAQALRDFNQKDYGDAARLFNEALKFIDYLSPKQVENARFLLGKSYYLDKDYVDAIVALEDYVFYYPKLTRTQEAYYMLIDSYIKIAPDPYRDQEYTWKAIDRARDFLSMFPGTPFASKVQRLIEEAYRKIARHELYIARFYEDYGYPYSASVRYRELLLNFSSYISEQEVAYRYIRSLLNADLQAERQKERFLSMKRELEERLKEASEEDVKRAIRKRIEFFEREIKRWEDIVRSSREKAIEAMRKYREVYGENRYYKELEELLRKKNGKAEADKGAS